jgi:stage IV sporulation protein FB
MAGCCIQRWSVSLGRWWGVPVRLHIFFLIFAVLALAFTIPPGLAGAGAMAVGILLASLLLHEAGHALAAARVGGKVDAIVVGPVGGLISPRVPDEPETQLFVALAGPIVHLTLVVAAAVVITLAGETSVIGLLHPLAPLDLMEGGDWLVAAKLTLWLNWILMLLNLLPAYPFDGGPILRSMLWPAVGRRTARVVTSRIAMVISVGVCGSALLTIGADSETPIPMWIPLITLGIFLFFSAKQDVASAAPHELLDDLAGYHAGQESPGALEPMWQADEDDQAVLVEHQQRPEEHEQHRRALEAYEDARVDDILARLHNSSLDSLSPEEVEVLRSASERYRRRRPHEKA